MAEKKAQRGGRREGAGRKPDGQVKMIQTAFRVTPQQREKLKRLGGSAWLRAQIDAAPTPRVK